MKKILLITLILSFGLFVTNNAFSQGFRVNTFDDYRLEGSFAYNTFLGEDADLFQTTIKGFGSGFIMDLFTARNSMNIVSLGWDNVNISLGMGIAITKYRFENNLVLDRIGDEVIIYDDAIVHPERDYVNTFFGYGKSKIVYGSFFTPVNLNVTVGNLLISGGGLLDFYISGKHKRKYYEDGNKELEKVGNSDFRNYDLSKTKVGLNAFLMHIPTGLNVSITYMVTPFFKEDYLPTVNEFRISFGIKMDSKKSSLIKKKAKTTRQV